MKYFLRDVAVVWIGVSLAYLTMAGLAILATSWINP